MPAYEGGDFEPPAPVARALVRGPSGLALPNVPLLIDSGADITIIPRSVAEDVGAQVRPSDILVRLYDGTQTACYTAELTVTFLRYRFRGPFVVAESDYGLLGRNILNLLVCTLDGPGQVWSA